MHDGVLHIAAQALLQQHVGVLRFNFRGVGASQGISGRATDAEKAQSEYAPPEVGDLLAVARHLGEHHDSDRPVYAGYSFGAHILWLALARLNPERALLIAPPSTAMAFAPHSAAPDTQIQAIWCDQDHLVNPERFATDPTIRTTVLDGGDHFFSGNADALANAVISTLTNNSPTTD